MYLFHSPHDRSQTSYAVMLSEGEIRSAIVSKYLQDDNGKNFKLRNEIFQPEHIYKKHEEYIPQYQIYMVEGSSFASELGEISSKLGHPYEYISLPSEYLPLRQTVTTDDPHVDRLIKLVVHKDPAAIRELIVSFQIETNTEITRSYGKFKER